MNLIKKIRNKISIIYNLLIKSKKEWVLPKKCQLVIYDKAGYVFIAPYLKKYSHYVLCTRGESLNLLCVILSIFDTYFWKGKFFSAYCRQIIKITQAKLVLTLVDNSKNFYLLSSENKNVLTLFVQNGFRYKEMDIFSNIEHNEKYKVDFMLVFNRLVAKKYKKFIKGKTLEIGSLRNNHFQSKKKKFPSNKVVLISIYRRKDKNIIFWNKENKPILWDDFFNNDLKITKWLGEWCYKNNKELVICSNGRDAVQENFFYKSILEKTKSIWSISSKNFLFSSYETIDNADIVVSSISTLGYESFSRGKKTAFFPGRGNLINKDSWSFGWPIKLNNKGFFWCNNPEKSDFQNILNNLNKLSKEDWKKLSNKYLEDIMHYDSGNTKLKKFLKDIFYC